MGKYQGPYLTPQDEGAFQDMTVKPIRTWAGMSADVLALCPVCQGYGGWNLRLNEYGPGKHFQAACSQCMGWGYVERGSPDHWCIHVWERTTLSMHTHEERCPKCGITRMVDSSG